MRGNSTWDGGSEASDGRNDGRNDGGSDGDDGGNEEGVGYRRSLLQRWGGREVSMCPRARIP